MEDVSALQQLEHWKMFDEHWCEHKPSISVYVREHEWLEVQAWVYKNFAIMSGVSFFPYDNHVYQQAPYEPITEDRYNELLGTFPEHIDFNVVEHTDETEGSQTLACHGGACEL